MKCVCAHTEMPVYYSDLPMGSREPFKDLGSVFTDGNNNRYCGRRFIFKDPRLLSPFFEFLYSFVFFSPL